MDEWDSIDLSDLTDDSADQPETEETMVETAETQEEEKGAEAEEGTGQPAESAEKPDTDQYYELKHLDDIRRVTLDEMKTYAQKGLDWDRMKEARDKAIADNKRASAHEEFLKEMAGNEDVETFIDGVRAKRMAQRDGIDEGLALEKIKLARERAAFEAEKNPPADPVAEKRRQSYVDFAARFPGLKSADIPNEVWEAHQKGEDLTLAYLTYQNKSLSEKVNSLEQEAKNKTLSAGSMKSAGTAAKDEFDTLWYDGN